MLDRPILVPVMPKSACGHGALGCEMLNGDKSFISKVAYFEEYFMTKDMPLLRKCAPLATSGGR